MNRLAVAVLGAGFMGRIHAQAYASFPDVELKAICDPREEAARAVAGPLGAATETDYRRLLARDDLDAVSICTPEHLHREPVELAARAGKHVLVEKPLATDRGEAELLLAAARAAGRILMVNYSQRFVPEFYWAKQQIAAGAIGKPLIVRSLKNDAISVPTEMLRWAAKTSPIFFMTSHDLDLVRWYLEDEAEEVYAREVAGVLRARGVDVHDGVEALVRFRGGAIATFHSSWIHPNSFPSLTDSWLEIVGSAGVLSLGRGREHELYQAAGYRSPRFGTADEIGGVLQGAFRTSLELFLASIRTGSEPMTSAANTFGVTATQCAIMESLRTGRPVPVRLE